MARMKTLAYFENQADELRAKEIDYKLLSRRDLIGKLIKEYAKKNNIPYSEYKKVFEKFYGKYHA